MPDVTVKDLCVDTTATDLIAPFWATLLGLTPLRQGNGDYQLQAEVKERTVWVNGVPEPLETKNRVHVDVRVGGEIPGAVLLDVHERWNVMADPEGLQFCQFPPRPGATEGLFEVCVDCVDPLALATWWAERTGMTVHSKPDADWVWLEGPFPYDYWVFNPVPEPKTVKNRVHWDVTLVDATVEDLVAAGATVLGVEPSWTVLADPEGNEFCAF